MDDADIWESGIRVVPALREVESYTSQRRQIECKVTSFFRGVL